MSKLGFRSLVSIISIFGLLRLNVAVAEPFDETVRSYFQAGLFNKAAEALYSHLSSLTPLNSNLNQKPDQLPPGRLFDIGGYGLRLYCTGAEKEGVPTVILETGSGNSGISWVLVQKELSKYLRVCSYDRAGYGWSDRSPYNRNFEKIADELHSLLDSANISGPVVLVGHSIGGLIIRIYEKKYPDQVEGLVLVDSSEGFPGSAQPSDEQYAEELRSLDSRVRTLSANSLKYLLEATGLSPNTRNLLHSYLLTFMTTLDNKKQQETAYVEEDKFYRGALREVNNMVSSTLINKPLIVISSGYSRSLADTMVKSHNEIAKQSKKGVHIASPGEDHNIQWERPEVVVNALKKMVGME